jgi:hypothetical protein
VIRLKGNNCQAGSARTQCGNVGRTGG